MKLLLKMSVLQWLKILWHTGKNKPPNIITNNTTSSLTNWQNPFGTKGRTSILSCREYRASCRASFSIGRRKLTDLECCVTLLPSRWLHPLAPRKRLSPYGKRRDHFRHAFCIFYCLMNTPLNGWAFPLSGKHLPSGESTREMNGYDRYRLQEATTR